LKTAICVPENSLSDWFFVPKKSQPECLRLICFPPAGLSPVVFRSWASELPAGVSLYAVHLPGRTSRLREPALTSIPELANAIVCAIASLPPLPSVFFGHSMGAVLAAEVTRRLIGHSLPAPRHLIVSARRPPQIPDPNPPIAALSDAAFVAEIGRRYGGIPAEILAEPDVLALLLPSLRADMLALEKFQPGPRPPLPIPVSAFGGDADLLTPPSAIEAWQSETQAAFAMRIFPGGHFYLDAQRNAVLSEVTRIIAPMLTEAGLET
jgi:medium-chain acyl-[acyl-carrier-protein] hydrolase